MDANEDDLAKLNESLQELLAVLGNVRENPGISDNLKQSTEHLFGYAMCTQIRD